MGWDMVMKPLRLLKIAIGTLDTSADGQIIAMVRRCHEALKGTRGVVMSIAFLDLLYKKITWLVLAILKVCWCDRIQIQLFRTRDCCYAAEY